jgi:GT2 family glycosyltransferase
MICDIIIPVWNQLALTRDCIDSILKNTGGVGYRMVIIDNASSEDARLYLESVRDKEVGRAILIRNETNLGFVKAVNQGMDASDSPYVCVLNNDTLATDGWLAEMIKVAEGAPDIGVVNPSSNTLGQRPAKGEPIELYAEKIRGLSGRFVELGAAIGFCMLIKREVVQKIGQFDEIYGMGNFEDTDFSRRAIREGYKCVRACGAYVYHSENTSFSRIKTFDEDFRRNRAIFEFRWGRPRRVAYLLEAYDDNILKRIEQDSLRLARSGGWVFFYTKDNPALPEHSNIIRRRLPDKYFYLTALFSILKKKKKFDEIFAGTGAFGGILKRLSFIHKAKVGYY